MKMQEKKCSLQPRNRNEIYINQFWIFNSSVVKGLTGGWGWGEGAKINPKFDFLISNFAMLLAEKRLLVLAFFFSARKVSVET